MGLWFIDRWLKDAQTFANEESACFVEEAISALLPVVEKLQIGDDRFISSGICITVKGLLSYTSLKLQDKARALFKSWKIKNVDIKSMDVDNVAAYDDANSTSECPKPDFNATHVDQKSIGTEEENVNLTNDRKCSHITSAHADIKDKHPESVASPVKLDSVVKDPSVKEKVLRSPDENSNAQTSAASKQSAYVVVSDKCELVGEEVWYDNKLGTLPVDVNKGEASSLWGGSDGRIPLPGTQFTAVGTRPDASTHHRSERLLVKTSSFDRTTQPVIRPINGSIWEDFGKKDGRIFEQKGSNQGIDSVLMKTKDQETVESRIEGFGGSKVDEVMRQQRNKKKLSSKSSTYESSTTNCESSDSICQAEDTDIEDAAIDALYLVLKDIARQIVNEIEQSASSSSSSSSSSSESIFREQELESNNAIKELLTIENVSPAASEKAPFLNSSATTMPDSDSDLNDLEPLQLAHKEPRRNTENYFLEFDLNRELSSEDLDQNQDDTFCRVVVAPGMLAGPLNFEESLGWKGSASTSAFRPASLRRTSDNGRVLAGEALAMVHGKGKNFLILTTRQALAMIFNEWG